MRPAPITSLIAPEVDRAVGRMQTVVEMGRQARNTRVISLQMPLRTYTVNSTDPTFIADVQSLEAYVKDLLSVYEVRYETSPTAFVRPVLGPNKAALGKKLGPKLRAVTEAMAALSAEEIMAAVAKGELAVCDVVLTMAEMNYSVVAADVSGDIQVVSENGIVTALDTTIDRGLQAEGTARGIASRVQMMRKAAGLIPSDKIAVFYEVLSGADAAAAAADPEDDGAAAAADIPIPEVISLAKEVFESIIAIVPAPAAEMPDKSKVLAQETASFDGHAVKITIVAA